MTHSYADPERAKLTAGTALRAGGPPAKGQEGTFWGDPFVKLISLNTEDLTSLLVNYT